MHHNTLLEVAWTIIPVIILVVIAVPSFRLLYFEATIPKPDVTIKAIGKQWFWTYEYPGANAGFTYDSLGLSDADAAKAGKPRLLGVDNEVVVPVGKVVEVDTTGADVIHSWALPQMGVKMDAVPGRINRTWFKPTWPACLRPMLGIQRRPSRLMPIELMWWRGRVRGWPPAKSSPDRERRHPRGE